MAKSRKRNKRATTGKPGSGISLAREKFDRGELASARELLEELVKEQANSAECWHLFATVNFMMGDSPSAAEGFELAAKLAPADAKYLNDLASFYSSEQRHEEALPLFEQVNLITPDSVETAYNLATCLLQLHRYDRAIPQLLQLTQQAPDFSPAAFNLGLAYKQLGKYREAIPWLLRSLPLAEESPQIYIELARCYVQTNQLLRAREYFHKFPNSNLEPGLAEEIAEVNYLSGETQSALEMIDAIVKRFPNKSARLQLLRADIHLNTGKIAQASETLETLLRDIQSDLYPSASNLAARIGWKEKDALIADMERSLKCRLHEPEDELKLRFGLGQLYEAEGDFSRASTHISLANEIKAATRNYVSGALESTVDELEALGVKMPDGPALEDQDLAVSPVFVLGMPRSGTSLLAQILHAHQHIHNAGELGYFSQISRELKESFGLTEEYPAGISELDAKRLQRIRKPYESILLQHASEATHVVDKFPENFLHIALIRRLFPNASIVHLRRDPRDVALSIYFQNFAKANEYAWRLKDIAHYYVQYERAMRVWANERSSRIIEIEYAAIVDDMAGITRRLLDTLKLAWDPNCLKFYAAQSDVRTASHWQVRQPVYKHAVHRWRNYPELTEEFCNELRVQRGRYGLPDTYT